jgi:hypothetical protein
MRKSPENVDNRGNFDTKFAQNIIACAAQQHCPMAARDA